MPDRIEEFGKAETACISKDRKQLFVRYKPNIYYSRVKFNYDPTMSPFGSGKSQTIAIDLKPIDENTVNRFTRNIGNATRAKIGGKELLELKYAGARRLGGMDYIEKHVIDSAVPFSQDCVAIPVYARLDEALIGNSPESYVLERITLAPNIFYHYFVKQEPNGKIVKITKLPHFPITGYEDPLAKGISYFLYPVAAAIDIVTSPIQLPLFLHCIGRSMGDGSGGQSMWNFYCHWMDF